ncbi:MAG: hypothetical protein EOM76_10705, partial [Sphingobacteriia bacterium]|nr:hypothetical protein [Sphingobacteriia bacterium]
MVRKPSTDNASRETRSTNSLSPEASTASPIFAMVVSTPYMAALYSSEPSTFAFGTFFVVLAKEASVYF